MVIKNIFILLVIFFSITSVIGFVYASDIAYIYKNKARIDKNLVNLLSSSDLHVDYISEDSISKNLSSYKIIFIGDEYFSQPIPVKNYNAIIMNHYFGNKFGITNTNGVSKLSLTIPMQVDFEGKNLTVYNSVKDNYTDYLFYYYLGKSSKAPSTLSYAKTYNTGSGDLGDVISFIGKGSTLSTGDISSGNICFFGITQTNYWTQDAKDLFKDCADYAKLGITSNENTSSNSTNSTSPTNSTNVTNSNQTIICSKNSDCGADGFFGDNFCLGKNISRNYLTFTCNNPGLNTSSCSNKTNQKAISTCSYSCNNASCIQPPVCTKNFDCDDKNSSTEDLCVIISPGNQCVHNIYTNIIKFVSLTATSTTDSVTLYFSATPENNSIIKGYLLSMNKLNWTLVLSPTSSYTYAGLSPSTYYIFYAVAVDNLDRNSDEFNISVRTQDVIIPSVPDSPQSSGGGGGGSGGFSSASCTTQWKCSSWGECNSGRQTRTCSYPENFCDPNSKKPIEVQSCTEVKAEPEKQTSGNDSYPTESPKSEITGRSSLTGAVIGALGDYPLSFAGGFLVLIAMIYAFVKFRKK
ncbi:Uncharacterised protein [uncultured archaeon]|nr:Uncharacterised protein [uncultured archaeon]